MGLLGWETCLLQKCVLTESFWWQLDHGLAFGFPLGPIGPRGYCFNIVQDANLHTVWRDLRDALLLRYDFELCIIIERWRLCFRSERNFFFKGQLNFVTSSMFNSKGNLVLKFMTVSNISAMLGKHFRLSLYLILPSDSFFHSCDCKSIDISITLTINEIW